MYQTKWGALNTTGSGSCSTTGSRSDWSSWALVSRMKLPLPSSSAPRMKLRRSIGGGSCSPAIEIVGHVQPAQAVALGPLVEVVRVRRLGQAGQHGSLGRRQKLEVGDAEVDLGRGGDAVRLVAVIDLIEIRGQDALLALFAGVGAGQVACLQDLLDLARPEVALEHFLRAASRARTNCWVIVDAPRSRTPVTLSTAAAAMPFGS